ncbi:MAG: fumarylacetoacetate hydrolase family protein [Thermoguttaceae bacterium]|jgi:2-keto-4-pentenoate hydratase/2-oxohepta-3-ene-1,7-dioic acid hydratase in catechol pathway|nr:fumarylacetoacetate hydrolase family protein [Thermoguttaceae bacterium]
MRWQSTLAATFVTALLVVTSSTALGDEAAGIRYARFRVGDRVAYGIVEGDRLREIAGDLLGEHRATDRTHALADVGLLVPTEPRQVFALAGNYLSHMTRDEVPEKFKIPQPFLKAIGSLAPHGHPIIIPHDATEDIHYEAELVIVIGRQTRNVPQEEALDYVFGVTAGNDVSERFWQNDPEHRDVQWWRAKGADTFGPCGPFIVRGVDYDDLLLELRLNGELKQRERTSGMIHGVAATVSFMSRYVTLYPGDLIFTGTPGKTGPIRDGDVVEVKLEGVGVLRNPVVRQQRQGP